MKTSYDIVPYAKEPYFKKTPEETEKDMMLLVQKALDLGATRAVVITADDIVVDERAGSKCRIPRCYGYGRNLMCPPHAPTPEEVRKLVKKYKQALFLRKELDPKEACARNYLQMPPKDAAAQLHRFRMHEHNITTLAGKLEGEAFYLGYYLATAFGAGTCFLCGLNNLSPEGHLPLRTPCEGLETGVCAFPLRSRYSLEACGIDVYATAVNAGWPIYVVGQRSDPAKIEFVAAHGLVLLY
jgi:predicted metal-binding protein